MAETATVNMNKDEGPSREELIAEAQQQEAEPATSSDRPEWLPEKFQSPEDMAKAYSELERKQGESPSQPAAPSREEAESAGLDMASLESEWREKGELSAESYDKAAAAGYPKDIVDRYIEGQQAIVERQVGEIYGSVGGQDAYNQLIGWAADNLPEAEIDAFNATVASNDVSSISLAVKGLQARMNSGQAAEPSRQINGGSPAGADVFESVAQWQEAMRDPRYSTDPAYNKAVVAKLARSNI